FQEFSFDDAQKLVALYDVIANKVIGNIQNVIKRFRDIMDRHQKHRLADVFDKIIDAIANVPKNLNLNKYLEEALKQFGKYNDLPEPANKQIQEAIHHANKVTGDIKKDVLEFYN
ncbi:unnamed protein product, partial [Owenia fusiformis]